MRPFGSRRPKNNRKNTYVGTIRKSQLVTTYAPGSIVDFVNDTVMIAGTDSWGWDNDEEYIVHHENLQKLLGVQYFLEPKVDGKRRPFFSDRSEDIPSYRFPEILYCTSCRRLFHSSAFKYRTTHRLRCVCNRETLLPSRFVVVCPKGHIEDFPYDKWVHQGKACSVNPLRPELAMFNIEGRGSIESLVVKCESCGVTKGLASAFAQDALVGLVECTGKSPWLPSDDDQGCGEQLVTRLRSSSSVYFPATVSAIKIPPWSAKVFTILEKKFDILDMAGDKSEAIRRHVSPHVPDMSEEEVMSAYLRLKESRELEGRRTWTDVYYEEYCALTHDEAFDEEYSSQLLPAPQGYERWIEKTVAVDCLTEVNAFIGFTRLTPWNGSLDDERLAPISVRKHNWLPAVKMRGEGIFIQFKADLIEDWERRAGDFYEPMMSNLEKSWFWNERASAGYVLLHTFSHLLIRQLALESGYGIASLKERIYSTTLSDSGEKRTMAGVLIYTAAPDADGSLGGLVEQSYPERLGRLIDNMLIEAEWCSSDPLCIDSYGDRAQGTDSLNYAACYACALLPETSCEFRNVLLDRAALIGRPESPELGLFRTVLGEV